MSEKSILEQALLQVKTLEEAVRANAKGILASTMKQELNDLLKESMEEEEEEDVTEQVDDETPEEEDSEDVPSDSDAEEVGGDTENLDNELDSEIGAEGGDEIAPEDEMPMDDTSSDVDAGLDEPMDDEVLDMTGASHDEIIKVFKAMKDEDGIIVKKDGDDIEFSDGEDDYIIKLDGGEDVVDDIPVPDVTDDMDSDIDSDMGSDMEIPSDDEDVDDMDDELVNEDEEVVYEIELDDESDDEESDEKVEGDVDEAARTAAFGVRGLKSKKAFKAGRPELNEEISKLKKQNDEYKKALILFKEKLNEVAVFNASLAYATRLFTEQTTTKTEKLNILKRFDKVSTLNESKNLYNTIKTELETKLPVSESVVEKINTTPSTSSSKEVLSESKAYENPQFKRIKDLMGKVK